MFFPGIDIEFWKFNGGKNWLCRILFLIDGIPLIKALSYSLYVFFRMKLQFGLANMTGK